MKGKILTPKQWEKLRKNLNEYYQIVCTAMIYSGLRPDSEFWRFVEHPEWYENGKIFIPHIPMIQQSRVVRLSNRGKIAIQDLIDANIQKPRNRANVRDALHRAALGTTKVKRTINGKTKFLSRPKIMIPVGISAETLRRTMTAWLVASYPEKIYQILRSMGMDEENFEQYLGKEFTNQEISDMQRHVNGW